MRFIVATFALTCLSALTPAWAGLVDDINALRVAGCGGRAGTPARLQASRDLDGVAHEWSRGGRLREALSRVNYRALNSASMHIEGAPSEAALLQAISANYCETVIDPTYTAIGIFRAPREVYVVVALPFTAPAVRDARAVSDRVLTLVNQARAQPRKCGSTRFVAVPPLALSAQLSRAALLHAQDMAQHNFFEHEGSDGSTVAVRATRAGYEWRSVGENIAAGSTTAESVVKGWLESPGHCANIMAPAFAEMGIAYATDDKSKAGIYWSQVFGSRRQGK
ncbi:MAG TPA: CAP domain-containing protein [Povalibacter sp.]